MAGGGNIGGCRVVVDDREDKTGLDGKILNRREGIKTDRK